ncbi:hypothetical protein G6F63_015594 [Rhizopus arrhizus]|nr:hypothetical protein G6F63_015594 [Rhizopus arrhizus]
MGIHRMHQQQRHAGAPRALQHGRIVKQRQLAARTAETFHAVGGRTHDQEPTGARIPDQGDVGCQRLALASLRLDAIGLEVRGQRPGPCFEAAARLGVAAGKIA